MRPKKGVLEKDVRRKSVFVQKVPFLNDNRIHTGWSKKKFMM